MLSRLRACGSTGSALREELCERLWDDTFRAARARGISELRVGKQVKILQQSFLGSAVAFDRGMVHPLSPSLLLILLLLSLLLRVVW